MRIITPIGVAAAYAIHTRKSRSTEIAYALLMVPLMIPHIVVAVGVFFLFARAGLNNTMTGIILAHTMLAIPFVLITTLSGLQGFDMNQERAARSLGVNRLRAFLKVTIPEIEMERPRSSTLSAKSRLAVKQWIRAGKRPFPISSARMA